MTHIYKIANKNAQNEITFLLKQFANKNKQITITLGYEKGLSESKTLKIIV